MDSRVHQKTLVDFLLVYTTLFVTDNPKLLRTVIFDFEVTEPPVLFVI